MFREHALGRQEAFVGSACRVGRADPRRFPFGNGSAEGRDRRSQPVEEGFIADFGFSARADAVEVGLKEIGKVRVVDRSILCDYNASNFY